VITGQRFFESLADTGRRAGVAILQAPRQILEEASGGRDIRLFIGAPR